MQSAGSPPIGQSQPPSFLLGEQLEILHHVRDECGKVGRDRCDRIAAMGWGALGNACRIGSTSCMRSPVNRV